MKTLATLKNFKSKKAKNRIVRNLNRIMDIVVLDLDIEHSTITILHTSKSAWEKAKRELTCIGFPIIELQIENEGTAQ